MSGAFRNSYSNLIIFAALLALAGCRLETESAVNKPLPDPATTLAGKCVQIFYDDRPETAAYSLLQVQQAYNLLGHFPQLDRRIHTLSSYVMGQLDLCPSNIYLGSDYYAAIPKDFLTDFKNTKSRVAWLGYSFWNLGPDLGGIFGIDFMGFTSIEKDKATGQFGFFQDVLYRGEIFKKYLAQSASGVDCACEISKFVIKEPGRSQVLAEVRHTITGEVIPWALRAGNKFLFAELPFSYAHESDRYLVFADLLFDILGEPPQNKKRQAVIRLEDLHSQISLEEFAQALQIFKSEKVAPYLSIIPFFHDPLGAEGPATKQPEPMTNNRQFVQLLKSAIADGAVPLWHGVTHQYGQTANPESGASGVDYEFWDMVHNQPIPGESSTMIEDRLAEGHQVFAALGITPYAWLTPHYTASPLANKVFAKKFYWTMGRSIYYSPDLSNSVMQFYPYEIRGDYYGAYIIPENLNYISSERSVDDILRDAKRNLVLRDTWASAFFHPFLLQGDDPANTQLHQLIRGLKALGYEFK